MPTRRKPAYRCGPFQIDTAKRLLLKDGEPIAITAKVFDTLLVLIENRGQVVEKDVLLSRVWPGAVVEERNLTVNISALRKAFGENPQDHHYVVTVPGRGYRFVADVEEIAGTLDPAASRVAIARAESFSPRWAWIAATVSLALLAGFLLARSMRKPPAAAGTVRSIAVLPFRNLSRDPEQEFFSDGTTEALISHLSQIHALKVISHTTMLHFKGTSKAAREIGQELGVDAILEGSVQRSGGHVRISTRLVQASDNLSLWSGDYDRDLSDVLKLESEVASSIAREINVRVTTLEQKQLARSRRIDAQAQDEFLLGRYYHFKYNPADLPTAEQHLNKAIQIQPDYAAAYAELSVLYQDMAPQKRTEFFEAAGRAVELDPNLSEAHAALAGAKMLDWDWTGAEAEFRRAMELNPASLDACGCFAVLLTELGRFDEAAANIQHAENVNPMSAFVEGIYGYLLYDERRYHDAAVHLRRALELDPSNYIAMSGLTSAHLQLGQTKEALVLADRPEFRPSGLLARAYAEAGRRDDAERMLKTLAADHNADVYGVALTYFRLGDRNAGFDWLKKGFDAKDLLAPYVRLDPAMEAVRADPRFQALVARLGIPNRK